MLQRNARSRAVVERGSVALDRGHDLCGKEGLDDRGVGGNVAGIGTV